MKVETSNVLNTMALALLPSIILASACFFLVSLSHGGKEINDANALWFLGSFAFFLYVLCNINEGKDIFPRSMIYMSYLFWSSPIFSYAYIMVTRKQINEAYGSMAEVLWASMHTTEVLMVSGLIGGFGGLLLYFMGNKILKGKKDG